MGRLLSITAQTLWTAGLLLTAGAVRVHSQSIVIGPNVQISSAHSSARFREVRIAADPTASQRLIACGMPIFGRDSGVEVFMSYDRGVHWRATLLIGNEAGIRHDASDEDCEFGNHGDAYLSVDPYDDYEADANLLRTDFYSSPDGGSTWRHRASLNFIDGTRIAVDRTAGSGRDTIYILGASFNVGVFPLEGVARSSESSTVYRSIDKGLFFRTSIVAHYEPGKATRSAQYPRPAVLSNGTVVFLAQRDDSSFEVYLSRDHGRSFSREAIISNTGASSVVSPSLAVASEGAVRDRLYAFFCGKSVNGVQTPFLRVSDTEGKTWSRPLAISPSNGPCLYQEVAVNRFGVLGMSWYSGKPNRRYSTSTYDGQEIIRIAEPWNDLDVHFTASLDGGQSTLPSVIVNSPREQKPIKLVPEVLLEKSPSNSYQLSFRETSSNFGDTAGIVADSVGSFHPVWIDYRNGVGEIWTTTIDVAGTVASVKPVIIPSADAAMSSSEPRDVASKSDTPLRNTVKDTGGAPVSAGADARDMTAEFQVHVLKFTYNEENVYGACIQLKGPTNQLRRGTFLRVESGNWTRTTSILNADNGLPGIGARWLFTVSKFSAGTSKMARSGIRCIKVHVPPEEKELRSGGGVKFDLRVFPANE